MPDSRPGADFLIGGGEMGQRMRENDWSQTSFGPVENWPSSLKTSISIMLASRFAMVVAWGPEFRFFYNDRYRPVLGATKHPGALGTPAKEIFPEAWPFIGPLFESTRLGESVALDDVLIPLDRYGYLENCYFTLSYSPIRDESGAVGGMLAVVAETTERVEGERRLKTLRDLARRSTEAKTAEQACANAAAICGENPIDVPFGLFYLLSKDGSSARLMSSSGIDPANPAVRQHVNFTNAGTDPWQLAEVAAAREARVLTNLAQFGNLPGGPYPEPAHSAIVMPLARPGQKQVDCIVVLGISPRRALDDSYRGFMDLVADHILSAVRNALAHQEERERAEALAELDRAKTDFFSNVSHEFRTPLTLMLGPLEDVMSSKTGTVDEVVRERIQLAHRNSLRLLKLVNTLLDFSRIEAERLQAVYEPVDLSTYTSELAGVFQSTIERAGLQFVVSCPPLDEPVYIDREMWEKIVFNLLSNAFKFTFEGRIDVALRRTDDNRAQLTVTDTGTGIPAAEIPHVFKRFHRVRGAKGRTYEGTGIGLALVQELVRIHGGSVAVTSVEGKGTTFAVTLPFGREHLPAERIGVVKNAGTTSVGSDVYIDEMQRWQPEGANDAGAFALKHARADKPRILLADDNSEMRSYVARLLSPHYEVISVPDGLAALQAARQHRPALILSDIMMPRLDGVGLLEAIRADQDLRPTPVILLSARAGEEARVEGLLAGADDYLVKPFSARELIARVETHLQMTQVRSESEAMIRRLKDELQLQLLDLRHSEAAERARAAELQTLMSAVPAAVFITKDPELREIYGSESAYELLRLPRGANLSLTGAMEQASQHFKILRKGVELGLDDLPVRAAARGIEQRGLEMELIFDDGSRVDLYGNAMPLRDSEGKLTGSIATFVDITERKQAERRLELQYEITRIIAANEPLFLTTQRILQLITESLQWDLGAAWTVDGEVQQLECLTVWHKPSVLVPEFADATRTMRFQSGTGLPGRVWKTGEPTWIEDLGTDVNFPRLQIALKEDLHSAFAFPLVLHGEILGILEFFSHRMVKPDSDLLIALSSVGSQLGQFIERKKMEDDRSKLLASERSARAELEFEREILETVNRSGQMLSAHLDLEKTVQSLTDAATQITGAQFGSFFYNVLDERGQSYLLYTLSGVSREHFKHFPMPRSTDLFGPTFRGEGTVRIDDVRKDPRYGKNAPYYGMPKGHLPVTSYLAVPVISRSGEVLGGLFFGHAEAGAFTERHERMVEGLAGQAAIAMDNARLFEAAKKARSEAELANRLKDEFLATVSHELRTPLSAMLGWARLLRSGRLDETRQAQAIEVMERNALAQQQIIEDILDVSRIITGKLRLEIAPVELERIVAEAVDSVRPAAEAKGVRLQYIADSAANLVLGDASRLQQVVWNLLSNAVKFTPRNGRVQIAVERINSHAEISVRDTGKGIPPEFLPHVFERFRQADSSSTRQYGGLGLGLAIVRHLTELHGGTVAAASPGEGQGATFTVKLPLAIIHESREMLASSDLHLHTPPSKISSEVTLSLDGVKVLAIDDESDARELLGVVLSQSKAEIRTAASATEALRILDEWLPDVIISDIGMPSLDGYALIRSIRARSPERGGKIPAAALTAYARSEDRVKALAAGYQTHVSKPVDPSELVAIVASLAGRTGGA